MSGHSHWSTIKRKKEANDQKRGQIFSKLAKAIIFAAKDDADVSSNFKLRLLIEKAKQANMPKQSVKRAIEKGSGKAGTNALIEIVYEGYGPSGVAFIVETVTDNRNRTIAEIKNIFERGGGSLAGPGAVSFQFKKAGLLVLEKQKNSDDQILKLIDLGAGDVEEKKEGIEVYTQPENFNQLKQKIQKENMLIITAELVSQPKMLVKIDDQSKKNKVLKLFDLLETHDDVQKVYTNLA